MCGRYTLSVPGEILAQAFDLESVPDVQARFNIAPSQEALVIVLRSSGVRAAGRLRWGLEPEWTGTAGRRTFINARVETASERPAFRDSMARRRCLVPADGFYEWRRENGKQPYFFELQHGLPFAFAGIWSRRRDREQPASFAILTTRPNLLVAEVHDRMPLIVRPEQYGLWLARRALSAEEAAGLAEPYDAGAMSSWPVSRLVNSPANDSPACRRPRVDGPSR